MCSNKKMGVKIKELMKVRNVSARELADSTGFSFMDIQRVMSGELLLTPSTIDIIAKVLGVTKKDIVKSL